MFLWQRIEIQVTVRIQKMPPLIYIKKDIAQLTFLCEIYKNAIFLQRVINKKLSKAEELPTNKHNLLKNPHTVHHSQIAWTQTSMLKDHRFKCGRF